MPATRWWEGIFYTRGTINFFRSEEHVGRWLKINGYQPGATISAAKLSDLAYPWELTNLADDWTPRLRDESQAILDGLGLTNPFWQLPT